MLNVPIQEALASVEYSRESLLRIRDKVSGSSYVIPELRCEDFAVCPPHRPEGEWACQVDSHLEDETSQHEGPVTKQSLLNTTDKLHVLPNGDMAHSNIPDSAIQPSGLSVLRYDQLRKVWLKQKGGGVCFLINDRWCTDAAVMEKTCMANLECLVIKCHPFLSPSKILVRISCQLFTSILELTPPLLLLNWLT